MTKLYWFSGTGNTLASAKQIAALLGGETYSIGVLMTSSAENALIEAERVVLLFPAYAYGAPLLVKRFLQKYRIRAPYIAALVTYGTDPGGALSDIYFALRRQGARLDFAGRIPCVENYIPIFGLPSEAVRQKRLAMQRQGGEKAAQAIAAGQSSRRPWLFRPLSGFVSTLFRFGKGLFVKGYRVFPECTGCGLCARICPASAIAMRSGKPVFSSRCEHCQACLNWCPARAIGYIRLKPDTPRYHHPDITISGMLKT